MKPGLRTVVHVDPERCINCHACISVCPVKDCNNGSSDHVEVNQDLCIGCGQCIHICRHEARRIVDDSEEFFSALEAQTPTVALLAPSAVSNFPGLVPNLVGWLKSLGVDAVFDVSFGAELATWSYVQHLREDSPKTVISQPCPALVTYLEVYEPSLLEYLAPIASPIGHTHRMVREFFPQYARHRIVSITPCIAKRRETSDKDDGPSWNVTYVSLMEKLTANAVDLAHVAPAEFDGPRGRGAGHFPTPGGLTSSLIGWLGDRLATRRIEGVESVLEYLSHLPEQIQRDRAPVLVDCLCCEKGCNGGSATLRHDDSIEELEFHQRATREDTPQEHPDKELILQYWRPGLYAHRYVDRSSDARLETPADRQIEDIYRAMLKQTPEDELNCMSCGYGSCRAMARAIHNGLNKPENCHHYRELRVNETVDRLEETQAELTKHRDHLEDLVAERTSELTRTNEQLQDEVTLRRQMERQMADIINFLPDPTFVMDADGEVLFWNQAMQELTGVTLEDLRQMGPYPYAVPFYGHGKPVLADMVVNPDLLPKAKYDELREGEHTLTGEVFTPAVGISGMLAWAKARALFDSDGKCVGAIEAVRDVTEIRRHERELEDAMRRAEEASVAKSQFLANMSHEIRTPMNGILGTLELLEDLITSDEQREYFDMAATSGRALLTVINDILDFSKVEAGRLDLVIEDFDLPNCVTDSVRDLANRASRKGLELVCVLSPDLPQRVLGDPGRLRQVLVNLVGNAVKFTPSGEIAVCVDVDHDSPAEGEVDLFFQVRDTGIGIPPEAMDRIFHAFEQVDASSTRQFGGTGLGLAISQQLVRLMGGSISVQSQPGNGSTFGFAIRVPVAQPSGQQEHRGDLADKTVLIVDDNETNLRVLAEHVSGWGADACTARSAADAVAAVDRLVAEGKRPDLFLLDLKMPEVDGLDLADRLRMDPIVGETPVVLMASVLEQRDADVRRAPLAGVLVKPVKQTELRNTLLRCLTAAPRPTANTPNASDQPSNCHGRLLLAEDNPINQRLATAILTKAGYDVTVANDGQEAFDAWRVGGFDAVLMDIQMPILNGMEAVAAIRQAEQTTGRHTPIIAMSAHALQGDRERFLRAGMDEYIAKPFCRRTLLAILADLLAAARAGVAASEPSG